MTIIANIFPGKSLYEILNIEADASTTQIKKAYHKLSLIHHPDKPTGSKEMFQALSTVYQILSNEDTRRTYDETGEIDERSEEDVDTSEWEDYFRRVFKRVEISDIEAFQQEYKESKEEADDVLLYYKKFEGDLEKMFECVMLSDETEDLDRWVREIIDPAIKAGQVKKYAMYSDGLATFKKNNNGKKKTAAKGRRNNAKKKKQKEAEEAAELMAKIRSNQLTRVSGRGGLNDLISNIESKYAGTSSKKGSGRKTKTAQPDDIPDDEFERIQARLTKNKGRK